MKKYAAIILMLSVSSMLAACSPEVGTKAWCENMGDKPKGEWTTSEAAQFAKHCVFGNYKKN